MLLFAPEDLVGQRFRSYASDAAVTLRRALGAEPVVIEWERTYEAFKQGLVDTFLVPAAHFYSLSPQIGQVRDASELRLHAEPDCSHKRA